MADNETETYEFDPWETSSGLPDFLQVRIENPHFGHNAEIQNGQVCLFVPEGTILSGDGIEQPEPFTQFYGCGPGWEPAGKGRTRVVREDGKARKFNNNVAYAHLFTSLKKAAEAQEMWDTLRKRGTPFDASLWANLTVDLERVQLPEFEGSDGKMVKRSVLEVKSIVKMGDTTTPAATAKEEVDEKASVSSGSSGGDALSNGELDVKLKAKLKAAARSVQEAGGEHKAFVEKAFDIEGVLDNATAEQAVMDEGEGSIWLSVQS